MARIGAGMASISYRKPDSMNAGRKPEKSAICDARNWLRVTEEISSPWPSAGTMKTAESSSSAASDPRSGTSNMKTASAVAPSVASMPSRK